MTFGAGPGVNDTHPASLGGAGRESRGVPAALTTKHTPWAILALPLNENFNKRN